MSITFKCKHCGKVLMVHSRDAGKLGKCKQCRRPVRAPIPTALPAEQPAVSRQLGRSGLLSELKAHPLWCVAGAFAFVVLVGAIVLLNISSKTDKTDLPLIDTDAGNSDKTEREYAQETGLNGTDFRSEEKVEIESSKTSKANDNILAANLAEEELTSLPIWAQIILDRELFRNGSIWERAEGTFQKYAEDKPGIFEDLEKTEDIRVIDIEPNLLSSLSDKYGPAQIKHEEKITWYRYEMLAFGKSSDNKVSMIRAPVRLISGGFVKTAKACASPAPSSFFIVGEDEREEAQEQGKVKIVNKRNTQIRLLIGKVGPWYFDYNQTIVLSLSAANYQVEVLSTEDTTGSIMIVPAFSGAVWEIGDAPESNLSGCVYVKADSDPSNDVPKVNLTLVNKHTVTLTVRVGYDGRYYRLKPNQQQALHLRKKKYVVCIESDDGRPTYQVAQASENIAWDINATLDETNFCIDVNDKPAIHGQLPQIDIPAQPIASPFDPNQPVGQVQVFEGHLDAVSNVAFSPDGSKVLSCGGGKDKTIRLWDISAETEFQCFEARQQSITKLAFSSDGRHAWSYNSTDYSVRYFDLQNGEQIGGFKQNICTNRTVAFSRSAQHLLVADKALFIWELEMGELSLSFEPQQDVNSTEQIMEVALSPDEQYVLVGFDNGNVQLWYMDEETSKEILIHQLSGHMAWINSVDFSPDGQLAVSGGGYCMWPNSPNKSLKRGLGSVSEDCTVRVWDLDSGQEIACFDKHQEPVTTVAFSPDGQRILSGGYDNTVRLWDIGSSKEVICFSEHTGPVNGVAFSPDGSLAVSASNDRTVRMWKLPEPIEVVKEDIAENKDDKVSGETREPATLKRSESTGRRLLNIRFSEITQIAPAVQMTGQRIMMWPIHNDVLGVVKADVEDFLWVLAGVEQRRAKKEVSKLSIRDVNDNEVGSLYAWVDAFNYREPLINIISFVDGGKIRIEELPDQKAAELLYNLAAGRWIDRKKDILLIFKGKYRSREDFYLDGPNIHVLLHPGRRRSRRNTPLLVPPRIGSSRQNLDRNNIRNASERERSGRASPRGRTRQR